MARFGVGAMLGSLITVLVGVALIPVIFTHVTNANITDPTVALIVSLIPLLFSISIVVAVLKPMT